MSSIVVHGLDSCQLFLAVLAIQESHCRNHMPQAEAQHLQEMTPGTSAAQQPPPPQRPKDGPWDFLKSWVWHVCKTAAATDARQTASLRFKCPEAAEIRTPEPSA